MHPKAIDMGIQASYLTKTKQVLSDRYTALSTALKKHLPEGAHASSLAVRCLLQPIVIYPAMEADMQGRCCFSQARHSRCQTADISCSCGCPRVR